MRTPLAIVTLVIAASGCTPAGSTASRDFNDVAGGESTPGEREIDRAADASELGVRLADDGSVTAGSTEPGETAEHHRATIRREGEQRQLERDVRTLSADERDDEEAIVPVLTPIPARREARQGRHGSADLELHLDPD